MNPDVLLSSLFLAQTWAEKITSISIPENVVVTLYTEENNKGFFYFTLRVIKLISPFS